MRRALVLNVDLMPLGVVSLQRAVNLVLSEKAEVVAVADGLVRSVEVELQAPAVVRLTRYVHVPYRARAPLTRRGVLARDQHRCAYCPRRADTVDHVVPRSRGGKHRWENVVAACRRCNHRKRDRTPDEAGLELRHEPRVPAGALALVVVLKELDEKWEPYLLDEEAVA